MARLPEVEPLGDVRWARIEQSLMQRLDELPSAEPKSTQARGRARVWPVALVATFAVSAAAAVALHVTRPHVTASSSRVVTEASASHVTIAESSLDVSPESGIEIREEERATVLTLERGEVSLHVAPREKDRPFLVEAGDVHVRVVGTEFTVRRVGVGAAVTVRRGVVEVREHGELALLRSGDHWPSDGKSDLVPAAAIPQTSTPTLSSTPTLNAALNSTPTLTPSPSPTHVARPTRPRVAPVSAPAAPPPPSAPVSPLSVPPVPPQDTGPLPTPEPTAQSRYESAAQLERTDPARALRAYTELAHGSDAWAQNALYAAGRLQADRGARTDAVRLLEEYLRRFPRGSNAQDARALREFLR